MTNPNVPDSSKTVRQSFQTHEQQSALIEQTKQQDAELQSKANNSELRQSIDTCENCEAKENCILYSLYISALEE